MNTQFNFKKTAALIVTLALLFTGAAQRAADASYICGCGDPPPAPGTPPSGASR